MSLADKRLLYSHINSVLDKLEEGLKRLEVISDPW